LAEKPAFRSAFQRRRYLVPMAEFYEWQTITHWKWRVYDEQKGRWRELSYRMTAEQAG
jgi:putative SOS response-associated peptidase YedK